MKKPKKTLKDLARLEAHLAKQTARTAKLLLRRKGSDHEANPVTAGFYERIASAHAQALADHSDITHLIEDLSRKVAEAQEAKQAKAARVLSKAATPAPAEKGKRKSPAARPARKPAQKAAVPKASASKTSGTKVSARKTSAAKAMPRKAATPRAPRRTPASD